MINDTANAQASAGLNVAHYVGILAIGAIAILVAMRIVFEK